MEIYLVMRGALQDVLEDEGSYANDMRSCRGLLGLQGLWGVGRQVGMTVWIAVCTDDSVLCWTRITCMHHRARACSVTSMTASTF
jgi:hypothetical protein